MRHDPVRRTLDGELASARARRAGEPPRVLDVGGGSGVLAVPLAAAGCAVTVVEPNPDALATLRRRAEEAGVADRITSVQGEGDLLAELVPAAGADLVLGHGLLEVVDDPKNTVAAMAGAVAPGGAVSVLASSRYAAALHRAIAGRLADAGRLLDDPAGRLPGEPLLRRFDTDGLTQLLTGSGLVVELVQGSGVLTDLVPAPVLETQLGAADAIAELELRMAGVAALRELATRLHVIARRG